MLYCPLSFIWTKYLWSSLTIWTKYLWSSLTRRETYDNFRLSVGFLTICSFILLSGCKITEAISACEGSAASNSLEHMVPCKSCITQCMAIFFYFYFFICILGRFVLFYTLCTIISEEIIARTKTWVSLPYSTWLLWEFFYRFSRFDSPTSWPLLRLLQVF